jgi:hypothetical protein
VHAKSAQKRIIISHNVELENDCIKSSYIGNVMLLLEIYKQHPEFLLMNSSVLYETKSEDFQNDTTLLLSGDVP